MLYVCEREKEKERERYIIWYVSVKKNEAEEII